MAVPPDVCSSFSNFVNFSGLNLGWIGGEKQDSNRSFERFFLWVSIWDESTLVSETSAIIHDQSF